MQRRSAAGSTATLAASLPEPLRGFVRHPNWTRAWIVARIYLNWGEDSCSSATREVTVNWGEGYLSGQW